MAGVIFDRRWPGLPFVLALLFLSVPVLADEVRTGTMATQATSTAGNDRTEGELADARAKAGTEGSNPAVHVRLGYLLLEKGALDEAMAAFDEALKLNPRSGEAKTGRGIVFARRGNLPEAEAALKDALLLNPNPVRAHYELGLVYEKQGDLEKALAEFKEGVRKHEQGR